MMLLSRQQRNDIFAVREPGEETVEQEQKKERHHEPVEHLRTVTEIKENPLHRGGREKAKKRPLRPPSACPVKKSGRNQNAEDKKKHPQ